MQNSEAMAVSAALLAAAGELTRRIHDGVVARGFEGVRPAHGFAFTRLAPDGATVTELAGHLRVTKQAASQLVEELVRRGYVERRPHPADARARLVVLTEAGWACTRAAEEAAADAVAEWADALGEGGVAELRDRLLRIAPGGPIRPVW
ncbi:MULTISPECIES: MarR family winged helix-turn-helix transcriptional regulator [Streptomyces]|uniref:MarR family winged helix-turn-helix transcriptional regulator n=1 Tax=Streptomyces TaxID=1883 RepID=UPI0002EB4547|nr:MULTISPECIES: MarR family winged helix-turn-helix transcriptional regulator [Streptomyces]MBQ0878932.1 winged helix-turn-helix transcriptional regulator [Streptomyces sp. RT42]RSS21674.1 MarR family transcriptional regulator [Streptomyces sp. WAC05458]WDI17616.1 MarR family winged helix-turn-helix transcriptional regulator [Streptomyces enissocaesilis]WQC12005.1 MarR family winged helix-turn-helix transcriptional regulator [Streptomyces rochei]